MYKLFHFESLKKSICNSNKPIDLPLVIVNSTKFVWPNSQLDCGSPLGTAATVLKKSFCIIVNMADLIKPKPNINLKTTVPFTKDKTLLPTAREGNVF